MTNLRSLVISIAVLILMVGVAVPIFNTIQEERVNLAFFELMESEILETGGSKVRLDESNEPFVYLMKQPKQALKKCLRYETENPDAENLLLNTTLGMMAYRQIHDQEFALDGLSLNETVKKQDPKLYEQLTKK